MATLLEFRRVLFRSFNPMKRTRRKFTAKFKTQVVLEAIKERQTLSELAERFKLHPNQVTTWKKEFLNNAEEAFAKKSSKKDTTEKEIEELYQKIGRLEMEKDFLKKSLGEI